MSRFIACALFKIAVQWTPCCRQLRQNLSRNIEWPKIRLTVSKMYCTRKYVTSLLVTEFMDIVWRTFLCVHYRSRNSWHSSVLASKFWTECCRLTDPPATYTHTHTHTHTHTREYVCANCVIKLSLELCSMGRFHIQCITSGVYSAVIRWHCSINTRRYVEFQVFQTACVYCDFSCLAVTGAEFLFE